MFRRKKSKRNPKPFRRFDEVGSNSFPIFEWVCIVIAVVINFIAWWGIICTINL